MGVSGGVSGGSEGGFNVTVSPFKVAKREVRVCANE